MEEQKKSETDPHIHGQLTFLKSAEVIKWRKRDIVNKQGRDIREVMALAPYFMPCLQINEN